MSDSQAENPPKIEMDLSRIPDISEAFGDIRFVQQQEPGGCGVTCLVDAALYVLGEEADQERVAEALGFDPKDGTSPNRIVEGGRMLGLEVEKVTGLSLYELFIELKEASRSTRIVVDVMNNRPVSQGGHWDGPFGEYEGGHYLIFEGLVVLNDQVCAVFNNPEFPRRIDFILYDEAEKLHYDWTKNPDGSYERINKLAFIFREELEPSIPPDQ